MINPKKFLKPLILAAGITLSAATPVLALATTGNAAVTKPTVPAASQQSLSDLKSRGNTEINRRLTSLKKLDSVINSTVKLSANDKNSLTKEVNGTISGLNTLKTTLDKDSDVTAARNDAQAIVDDYRVYALVGPKVYLLKTSDTELVNADNLAALAAKLQSRINANKGIGKDISGLQAQLADMNSQISAAQSLASELNTKVTALQPTDYNNDHTILEGQKTQLQTAHQDNTKAYQDAKSIVASLKNL